MIKRHATITALAFVCLQPLLAESAQLPDTFAGRVVLASQVPMARSNLRICQKINGRSKCTTAKSNSKGYFIARYDRSGSPLSIVANGGRVNGKYVNYTLRRSDYTPNKEGFAWISPETSIAATLLKLSPTTTKAEAEIRVRKTIGVSHGNDPIMSDFSAYYFRHGRVSLDKLNQAIRASRGFEKLVKKIAMSALTGDQTYSFSDSALSQEAAWIKGARSEDIASVSSLMATVGENLALGFLQGAGGQVGGLAMGWILTELGLANPQQSTLTQMSSQLANISQQLNDLNSELQNITAQFNSDFNALTQQIDGLENQLDIEILTQTTDAMQPCIAQLTTLTQNYAALTSQASETTASISTLQSLSSALYEQIIGGTPSAQTCLNTLPSLLIPAPPLHSYYYQYATVLTNSLHPILNATSSNMIANQFAIYYDWVVTAESMAIAGAQYNDITNPVVSTLTGVQQTFANQSNSIMPQPLPANTALQVSGFWSETASDLQASGFNGQLMWATNLLSGITLPSPQPQSNLLSGPLAGTVAGPNGQTLATWFVVADNDIDQLLALNTTNSTGVAFISSLLGLNAAYASQLSNYGIWDNAQSCADVPSVFPITAPATSMSCATGTSGSAAWMAARPVTVTESYLPTN